jgi:hypothetical protein
MNGERELIGDQSNPMPDNRVPSVDSSWSRIYPPWLMLKIPQSVKPASTSAKASCVPFGEKDQATHRPSAFKLLLYQWRVKRC